MNLQTHFCHSEGISWAAHYRRSALQFMHYIKFDICHTKSQPVPEIFASVARTIFKTVKGTLLIYNVKSLSLNLEGDLYFRNQSERLTL